MNSPATAVIIEVVPKAITISSFNTTSDITSDVGITIKSYARSEMEEGLERQVVWKLPGGVPGHLSG